MAHRSAHALPTLWHVPDDLWTVIAKILNELDPPCLTGRSRIDQRKALNGILYRARTGCQWNHLPREFGDDSSVHRTFQRWEQKGILDEIWGVLVEECDAFNGVQWRWQAADGAMGKARHGGDGIGKSPTDRGKRGTKRSVIVDAEGGPLGIVVAGANVHDTKLLSETIEAIIVERPKQAEHEQHICLDKGYDNPTGHSTVEEHDYIGHIRPIKEEGAKKHKGKPRRWVVERTLGWLNRWRGILVRYDKKASNYLGVLKLACALLWYRRLRDMGVALG
jgi:putative transposase